MSLSNTIGPLLSTGSIQEDQFQHDYKIVDWDVKNLNKNKQQPMWSSGCKMSQSLLQVQALTLFRP